MKNKNIIIITSNLIFFYFLSCNLPKDPSKYIYSVIIQPNLIFTIETDFLGERSTLNVYAKPNRKIIEYRLPCTPYLDSVVNNKIFLSKHFYSGGNKKQVLLTRSDSGRLSFEYFSFHLNYFIDDVGVTGKSKKLSLYKIDGSNLFFQNCLTEQLECVNLSDVVNHGGELRLRKNVGMAINTFPISNCNGKLFNSLDCLNKIVFPKK